jgi:POT family proton-dependent oligopeptide transporter
MTTAAAKPGTLFGHPTGLFALFFAEMWERFSYYGMRALLIYYMVKGFLGYGDNRAYAVYGAYTALVYATPFIGGMLADRILGARRSVILGGLLMAAGHLLMTIETETAFFGALALLIVGNGFFKPNISTIVGDLYPGKLSEKRDGGFTIFYMGINLGAAMSPLLCGYVGETYGWHYGFGLATIGMLVGLAVFVMPLRVTQFLILLGALGAAAAMILLTNNVYILITNIFVAIALVAAGVVAFTALGRGGLPDDVGRPRSPERLHAPAFPALKQHAVPYYLGLIAAIMMLHHVIPPQSSWSLIVLIVGGALLTFPWVKTLPAIYISIVAAVPVIALLVQRDTVAGTLLTVFGGLALASIVRDAVSAPLIERHRLYVVLILMFFSMLFWSFFEQAGSSVSNFTDRNVDRVIEPRHVTPQEVGQPLTFEPTQEQLGFAQDGKTYVLNDLDDYRAEAQKQRLDQKEVPLATWTLDASHVGMGVAKTSDEIPASVFQAANPIFIILFGLLFTALWGFLAARRIEPSIPVKFALGLVQLGLGFLAFWYGAETADDRGMVWLGWLLLGYLLQTTGELCISPVGLSMVTKLSPKRIVSTVMGAWFLATAFSNLLAGIIAGLTGVTEEGGEGRIPPPSETLSVYGDVFLKIGIAAGISAVVLLVLAPLLNKWVHSEAPDDLESPPSPASDVS